MRTRSLIGAAGTMVAALLVWGCGSSGTTTSSKGAGGRATTTSSTGAGGAASQCQECVSDGDCKAGSRCAQFAGDSYCAPTCSETQSCSADRSCVPVSDVDGTQLQVCVPRTGPCGGGVGVGGSSTSSSTSG